MLRAFTADLAAKTAGVLPAEGLPPGDHFRPLWHPDGARLAIGLLPFGGETGAVALVPLAGGAPGFLPAPERGFDVPAAWAPDGSFLSVINYGGDSLANAGNPRIDLVAPTGQRAVVAEGAQFEVIGWFTQPPPPPDAHSVRPPGAHDIFERRKRMLKSLVNSVRRNHALEHATISILLSRQGPMRIVGRAVADGFYIYGDISTDRLREFADEALLRLQKGEAHLAVSPLCGTNIAVAGRASRTRLVRGDGRGAAKDWGSFGGDHGGDACGSCRTANRSPCAKALHDVTGAGRRANRIGETA